MYNEDIVVLDVIKYVIFLEIKIVCVFVANCGDKCVVLTKENKINHSDVL
jgi:hypothetical protein